jgi:F-box protein 11
MPGKLPWRAFLTYAHLDNVADDGYIDELRLKLENAVRTNGGPEDFRIFWDEKDIAWGQVWPGALDACLQQVYVLLPIITPLWFERPCCRDEYEKFKQRSEHLQRTDLVLPIYYTKLREAKKANAVKADQLIADIKRRQWVDWTELKLKPFKDPAVRTALTRMGQELVQKLEEIENAQDARIPVPQYKVPPPGWVEGIERTPRTDHVVTPSGKSTHPSVYKTLGEAVAAAADGDVITVTPGIYDESIEVRKAIEIVGDGPIEQIILRSQNRPTITINGNVRLTNLTIQEAAAGTSTVVIASGSPEIEDCDISGKAAVCVVVQAGAVPVLRFNRIHDGKIGVTFAANSRGTIESNDIYAQSEAGVVIADAAEPLLQRNSIHDMEGRGVKVLQGGRGRMRFNEIFKTRRPGVEISSASPLLVRNRIHGGNEIGVKVTGAGKVKLLRNEIYDNGQAGLEITGGADPLVLRNRIRNGRGAGLVVRNAGKGTIRCNEIFENAIANIEIRSEGNPLVRANIIYGGKGYGVLVQSHGTGTIEQNEIFGNEFAGVEIIMGGNPIVRNNCIHAGPWGVLVREDGKGIIENNLLFRNKDAGIGCRDQGSQPQVRGNRCFHNFEFGIKVEGGGGKFEKNKLWGNKKGSWSLSDTVALIDANAPQPPQVGPG